MIRRYGRTLKNYWRTAKGRHDLLDYARAIAIITATAVAMTFLIKAVN